MKEMSLTERIIRYIEDNLDKDLSLEKIAEELNYSRFYTARTFKEHTGMARSRRLPRHFGARMPARRRSTGGGGVLCPGRAGSTGA